MSSRRVQQPPEPDVGLGSGQGGAGTCMDAMAECDVLAPVPAVEPKIVGILELTRIAIGGAREHHERAGRRDLDVLDHGRQ